ncbi:MAG: hypothetical protein JNK00_05445 [Flavipsychrobacter sp.]|nr:hypothetical protein [Flavipsychrobacter sp.]
MKKLLIATSVSVFAMSQTSCKKMERDFVVTGKMIYTDNKETVKGKQFNLIVIERRGSFPNRKDRYIPYTYTTDSNGTFQVRCRARDGETWHITLTGLYSALHFGNSFSKKNTTVDAGTIEIKR